nr:sulfur carrier protein ThiS [Cohnella sp. YIM B05605]
MNGRPVLTGAETLLELAEQHGLAERRVVAEVGGVIVPRTGWGDFRLTAGASVEFVHFVGGG